MEGEFKMWGKGKKLCGGKDLKDIRRGFSWNKSFQIAQVPSPLNQRKTTVTLNLSCHFDAVVEAVLSTGCELGNVGFQRSKRKTNLNIQTEIWIQRESVL